MKGQAKQLVDGRLAGRYVQVTVFLEDTADFPIFAVVPGNNCPSSAARSEGRLCDECKHWGREVVAIDWAEFSLCGFGSKKRRSKGLTWLFSEATGDVGT